MNIITIFDGSKELIIDPINGTRYSPPLVPKGTFEVASDIILRRDITQLKTSEVKVVDKDQVIMPFDLMLFSYGNALRVGKVFTVERERGIAKITFTYGADIHQIDVPLYGRPSMSGVLITNRQAIVQTMSLWNTGNHTADTEDNVLSADTIIRQLMRKYHLLERYNISQNDELEDNAFYIYYQDRVAYTDPTPLPTINIRLDDPMISSSYLLKIGQDKMTRLRLFPSGDDAPVAWRDYQLLNDGSIVENTTGPTYPWFYDFIYSAVNANSVFPQRFRIKTASPDQIFNLNYAKEIFSQSEYDNEIEIEVPENNNVFKLGTVQGTNYAFDTLLGNPARVYLPGSGVYVDTKVSGYEIQNGKMKIIFGLARTRLTDVINNYVNKDNR